MKFFGSGDMLKSISTEIETYNDRKGRIAGYILIHEADINQLRQEMIKAKTLPDNGSIPFQVYGLRLIKTTDIRQGSFAVLGG